MQIDRKNGIRKAVVTMAALTALAIAAPAWAAKDSDEARKYVESGRSYIAKNDPRAAIIEFRNALKADPDNVEARRLLGELYLRTGQAEPAQKELEQALRRGAPRAEIVPLLARSLLLQGKYREVLNETRPEQFDGDARAEIHVVRGEAQLGLRDLNGAHDEFQQALKAKPGFVRARVGIAQVLTSRGSFVDAEKEIDGVLAVDPNSAEAYLMKGELRRVVRDFQGSVDSFSKSLQIRPNNLVALVGRAASNVDLGNDDDAEKDLKVVFERAPKHPLASYLTAMIRTRKGDYDGARNVITEAGPALEQHMPTVYILGAIAYSKGELEQAETLMTRYVERVPENLRARKLLGATLLRKHAPAKAMEILEPALASAPTDGQLLGLLGSAAMQLGRYTQSNEYFQRALEAEPETAGLQTQHALAALAAGQRGEAIESLEKAIDLDPDSGRAAIMLALVRLRQSEYDEAIKTAEKLKESQPGNPVPFNLIGAAQIGKNDLAGARQSFEAALKIKPDFHPAAMNLATLDARENNPVGARTRYRDILKADDKHLGALMGLAGMAFSDNNTDEAVELLRKAADGNPTAVQPRQRLIDHYLRGGDKARALNVARDFARQNPRNAAAVELLGRTEIAADEAVSAVETFRSLTQLVNDPLQAQRMVASAQIAAKDNPAARATYRDMLRANVKYLPAYIGLIDIEMRDGRFDDALRVARDAAVVQPDQPVTDILSGDIYLRARRPDDAAKSFEAAFTRAPSTDLALRLFSAQRAAGKTDAAYQHLGGWVAKNADDRRAHHLLASSYLTDDRLDDAMREYEKLLAAEPKNVGVLNNLAWIYQQKQNPKAAGLAAEAYQLAPEVAAVADTYGWILVRSGQTVQGLAMLQKANRLSPQDPEVSYHLAYALNASGKKDEARQMLKGLVEDGKAFRYLNDAKTLLQQLGG